MLLLLYSYSVYCAVACLLDASFLDSSVDLKRFSQDYAFRSKLSTEVKCATKNLDLRKFSSEKGHDKIFCNLLYRLCSHGVSNWALQINDSNSVNGTSLVLISFFVVGPMKTVFPE